jgi:8-oxo-dGTP pyrophosphatase MutT (NUDIX family)
MNKLFETPYFEIVELNGKYGVHTKTVSVAVMPFEVSQSGIIEKVGILKEYNPLRESNYADTLITGTIDISDADAFEAAVRELSEEGGYTLPKEDTSRWYFLGNFHDSKDSDRCYPTFAVDVTGIQKGEATTDGSYQEAHSHLEMVEVNEALQSSETLTLAAFLRLFNIMYQKSFQNAK